jgi:hypothetical protein
MAHEVAQVWGDHDLQAIVERERFCIDGMRTPLSMQASTIR